MSLDYTMLGPLLLSRNAILRGLLDQPRVTWEDKRTLGGVLISRPAVAIRGRLLTLELLKGRTTVGQLLQVQALIDAAQPVMLRHHVWCGLVRVNAINSTSLPIDYADYSPGHKASAEISLTEI